MKEKSKKPKTVKKKKAVKIGGLWVDPMSYPAFDHENDGTASPRS